MTFGDPLLHDWGRIRKMSPMPAVKILCRLCFRQTVEASKIATIRYADPQIAQNASMRIEQQVVMGHLAGGELVVCERPPGGGMTLTEPSALISTFKSYAGLAALA